MTKFKFEIIDLLGKTVWDDFVDAFKGENRKDLNLNKVTKAMYFLTLNVSDMEVKTLRIVVESMGKKDTSIRYIICSIKEIVHLQK